MVVESNLHDGNGIVRGDQFSVWRRISGVPPGATISEAWLTVKTAIVDVDGSAIFQKDITTTNVPGTGHVVNSGSSGGGLLRFDLTAANTMAMTAGTLYYYDIQILLSSGDVLTLESGETSARAQVTIDS